MGMVRGCRVARCRVSHCVAVWIRDAAPWTGEQPRKPARTPDTDCGGVGRVRPVTRPTLRVRAWRWPGRGRDRRLARSRTTADRAVSRDVTMSGPSRGETGRMIDCAGVLFLGIGRSSYGGGSMKKHVAYFPVWRNEKQHDSSRLSVRRSFNREISAHRSRWSVIASAGNALPSDRIQWSHIQPHAR